MAEDKYGGVYNEIRNQLDEEGNKENREALKKRVAEWKKLHPNARKNVIDQGVQAIKDSRGPIKTEE